MSWLVENPGPNYLKGYIDLILSLLAWGVDFNETNNYGA